MTKVLICGDLAWSNTEAREIFAGLAEIVVSTYHERCMLWTKCFLLSPSEWTLQTGPIF